MLALTRQRSMVVWRLPGLPAEVRALEDTPPPRVLTCSSPQQSWGLGKEPVLNKTGKGTLLGPVENHLFAIGIKRQQILAILSISSRSPVTVWVILSMGFSPLLEISR